METSKSRKISAQKTVRYWQRVLNLTNFAISIEFVDFNREDFVQSGDIEVDLNSRKAKILITSERNNNDSYTILHGLVHLMMWKFDHLCEGEFSDKDKSKYFGLLEETVAQITNAFYHQSK